MVWQKRGELEQGWSLSLRDMLCILPPQLSDTDLAGPLQKEIEKLQEMRAQRRPAAARE